MATKYKITQNYKIPAGVAGNYRKGHKQVEGVVVHASANPNASIDSEISYMAKNYKNAFTHAWAGHNKIVEIANTNYACWGAGAIANKRFAQIETTEDKRLTKKQKLQVIDHAAYWAAVQLVYYKLPCKDASKDGNGTVWGHVHVSKYLGGTDHTDPIAYFNSVGVSWNDFYKQVERYYNAYKKGTSDQVKSLDGTQGTSTPKPTPSKPSKPANKTIDTIAREVIDGKWGNDPERSRKLNKAGYNAASVQRRVNEILRGSKPKSSSVNIESLAKQVVRGIDTKGRRIPNGVNARAKHFGISVATMNKVQKRVNQLLS